eukprot:CAMPEP_0183454156 /NCGR_PEP_ID=MMETSP0370-20130417/123182_1 /TAXON_ID=268820 /ORGANISM="Peridinium aciculiferum, Strain PAER-2" /LENGTH=34 /DNA_ID= /DNA_START= /DNA_END= /DNA_ORIENTATION=
MTKQSPTTTAINAQLTAPVSAEPPAESTAMSTKP